VIGDNAWLDAFVRILAIAAGVPVAVIVLNYLERKVVGRIQNRLGPMRVGPYGTLQAVADTIKLLTKEDVRPTTADRWAFELAPYVVVVPTIVAMAALPFTQDLWVRNLGLALFFILAVSTVSIVGFLMAGWGSDNKYAILGAMRSAAQLISYEIPLVMAAVAVAMVAHVDGGRGSLNLIEIVEGQGRVPYLIWQPLAFFIFTVAAVAELYRQPFDIPVAESEVVGGPLVEYSGMRWAMFMMGEYVNLVLLSVLASLVFLGGWNWPLGDEVGPALQVPLMVIKVSAFILFFFWVRAALPRLRIDQLMAYSWQVLLPLAFYQIVVNGLALVYEWPDVALGALSAVGTMVAIYLTYKAVRRPVRRPAPVTQRVEV